MGPIGTSVLSFTVHTAIAALMKCDVIVALCVECVCTQVAALKAMAVQGGPTYSLSQQPWAQPGKTCLRKCHWHYAVIHQNVNSVC